MKQNKYIYIFKLTAIKTAAHNARLITILFFVTETSKFVVIYPGGEDAKKFTFNDKLKETNSYFVQNVTTVDKPGPILTFEARADTNITVSKRPLEKVLRLFFYINYNLKISICSVSLKMNIRKYLTT